MLRNARMAVLAWYRCSCICCSMINCFAAIPDASVCAQMETFFSFDQNRCLRPFLPAISDIKRSTSVGGHYQRALWRVRAGSSEACHILCWQFWSIQSRASTSTTTSNACSGRGSVLCPIRAAGPAEGRWLKKGQQDKANPEKFVWYHLCYKPTSCGALGSACEHGWELHGTPL